MDFEVMRKYKEILYDSDVYGGRVAYFKTAEMTGKVSIFSSGKLISSGTKDRNQAFKELESAMNFLASNHLAKKVKLQPKTQNIVAIADFEKSISLERISEDTNAIYEPEQFPGAILRLEAPYKATVLLFASGKAVVTGLKSSDQLRPTIRRIEEIISELPERK